MGQSIFIVDPAYGDVHWFEDPSDAVIEEIEDMRSQFEVAEELLKLIGRDRDAHLLDETTTMAYERNRKRPALTTSELAEIVAAIHGLTASFREHGYLGLDNIQSQEQIERLSHKTTALAYDKTHEGNRPYFLIQTLAGVATLEKVLQRAIDMNAHVALSD